MGSINKAQAAALAEGFLDKTGTSKDAVEFQPRNTYTEIILIAGELLEDAQKNLKRSNSIASGRLSQSLVADKPVKTGDTLSIKLYMNAYGKFVNKGVKGKKSGKSTAGYKFTKAGPSKAFVESIQKWIKRSHQQVRNVKKAVSSIERKRKSISELNKGRSVAYATAMSIMNKGLRPTGFLDKAVDKTRNKLATRLGAALKIDIIDSITR